MKYEHNFYKTSDEFLDIEFLFLYISEEEGWRAYFLTDINYKKCSVLRSSSAHIVHRLIESDNQRYVDKNKSYHYLCWTKKIHELDELRDIARIWCEITAYYIRHGGTFETIQPLLQSKGII